MSEAVEVVLKKGDDGGEGDWLCTGALVARDLVLTAGHCLGGDIWSGRVIAPLAKGKPEATVSWSAAFGMGDDPSEPDIGFLVLNEPIELPAYAQITDISARVDGGETLSGVAVVRTKPEAEAPFKAIDDLTISSTTKFGYDHGIGTQIFSQGGDSGAGLFLVENGKTTHKLVGIARNPEQSRGVDHFTRLWPAFQKWLEENAKGD